MRLGLFCWLAALGMGWIVCLPRALGADDATRFIPKESFGTISLNMKALREFPGGELFPFEYSDVYFADEYSFTPSTLDRVTWIFAADPKTAPQFSIGLVLEFAKPIDIRKHIAKKNDMEPHQVPYHEVDDLVIFNSDKRYDYFAVQVDSKKVLVSHSEPFVLLMAATKNANTDLTKAIPKGDSVPDLSVVLSTQRLAHVVGEPIKQSLLPKEIKELQGQIKLIQLKGNFEGIKLELETKITADKVQSARKVESGIKELLKYSDKSVGDYIQFRRKDLDDDELIWYSYLHRLLKIAKRDIEFDRESKVVSFKYEVKNFINLGWGFVILFLAN